MAREKQTAGTRMRSSREQVSEGGQMEPGQTGDIRQQRAALMRPVAVKPLKRQRMLPAQKKNQGQVKNTGFLSLEEKQTAVYMDKADKRWRTG